MNQERVHGRMAEIPALGTPQQERVPEMTFWREDDLTRTDPWGFRLYLTDVQPVGWITVEMVNQIVEAQDWALKVGWEPKAEIEWRDGAMLALTVRAVNGTWTWRFGDYDHQRNAYRLAWPD